MNRFHVPECANFLSERFLNVALPKERIREFQ